MRQVCRSSQAVSSVPRAKTGHSRLSSVMGYLTHTQETQLPYRAGLGPVALLLRGVT